jgi:hypothetical protein
LVEIPANEAVPNARLRAFHLSPDAPAVDIFVNGNLAIANTTFPAATAYAELPAGAYNIDVAPSGEDADATVLSVPGLELQAGRDYSAVAFGRLDNIQALALEDDRSPVSAGNIRVRAVHTADGVGQVDVLAIPGDGAENVLVYDDVDFGQFSASIEIPAAAITLGLDLDDDLMPEFTFDVPALPAGSVATLFAVLGSDGPFLFAATQTITAVLPANAPPADANLRVVHLSPDAPEVSVDVNGARAIESLSFFADSDYLAIAPGPTDIDVALAAQPDDAILSLTDVELAPGSFTSAVAYNTAAELAVLAVPDDMSPTADGNIRVRAVHVAVGIGTVDVYAVADAGNTKLFDDIAFGSYSDTLEVPAGQYTLGLDVNNDTHIDLTFHLPHLAAGTIGNIYAVTDAHGTAHLAVQ